MKKQTFVLPTIEYITFEESDVIVTSNPIFEVSPQNETPNIETPPIDIQNLSK